MSGVVLLAVGWLFGFFACLGLGAAYVTLRNLIEAANVSVRCVACDHELAEQHRVVREREQVAAKVARHRLQALGAGVIAIGATAAWLVIVGPKFKALGSRIGQNDELHELNETQIAEQIAKLPDERALVALIRCGSACVPAVARALKDDDPKVRNSATHALHGLAPRDPDTAIPALVEALSDDDALVRMNSVDALQAYGSAAKPALPALERAAAAAPPVEQVHLWEAINHVKR